MFEKYFKKLNLPESYISITLGFLVVIVAGLLLNNYLKAKKIETTPPADVKKEEVKEIEKTTFIPTIHTVERNDSLWKVAQKYYGSGYNWIDIAKENNLKNANRIEVGQKLNIPKAEIIKPVSKAILSTATIPDNYTVSKGDDLWKISVKIYGDGYVWSKIAAYNNLKNPNLIHSGNILRLPK